MKEFVKSLPLSNGCEVLAFDECGLVAISKREGRATHPNPNPSANAKPAMLRAEYDFDGEFYRWGGGQKLFLVNRLLANVSEYRIIKIKAIFTERITFNTLLIRVMISQTHTTNNITMFGKAF